MVVTSARHVRDGKADASDKNFVEGLDWVARQLQVPSRKAEDLINRFARATKKADNEKAARDAKAAARAKERERRAKLTPVIDKMLADGYSIRAISKALGIPKNQVEKRVKDADPNQLKFSLRPEKEEAVKVH
jgi:hypothetical protein